MDIQHFFDKNTATFTYVVSDTKTKHCAIIDPVLNYDMYSGTTSNNAIEALSTFIENNDLKVEWILETHVHADHISAAQLLKNKFGGKIAIGGKISDVLKYWVPIFNSVKNTPVDGSQFNHLFDDEETFSIGDITAKVIYTPGHTPACISYLIGDSVFVGDALLMPHIGTARTDFPGGSAQVLYESIQKIFALPDDTKIYTCHDYPTEGNNPRAWATVAEHKCNNIMIKEGISQETYIQTRTQKDKTMPVPKLLLPAIQVNMRAGHLTPQEDNGVSYIKIPINQL